jgi:hypothetical protein
MTSKQTIVACIFLMLASSMAAGASPPSQSKWDVPPPSAENMAKIEALQSATRRLQQAIGSMAQASAVPDHDDAIREADEALGATQKALAALPVNLVASCATELDYDKTVNYLEDTAQTLRAAIRALAAQPPDSVRTQALDLAHTTLTEVQEALMIVPPPVA